MLPQQISKRRLGKNGPEVSAIGLGTMAIGAFYGKTDMEESIKALTYAADRGMTFWDCADVYGTAEETLGEWFTKTGRRKEIFLATKFGAWDPDLDAPMAERPSISKPSYIHKAIARSLVHLKTDYIDLYYQHRVDPEVPIEVVMQTLKEYVDKGVVKWIGLSECSVEVLKRAKSVPGIGDKIIAAQMEFSPFALDIETLGFTNVAKELGVSIVPYSPLGHGMVSGRYRSRADFGADDHRLYMPRFSEENFPKNLEIVDKIQEIGKKYDATSSQITLAWILAENPDYVPIPGCRSASRVEENAAAADIKLEDEDVKAIRAVCEAAIGNTGSRYPEAFMATVMADCIELGDWKGE